MSEFNNATIIKEANIYFDGNVSSRTVKFDDGSRKTLGFMMPGKYTFGTNEYEVMEMMAGEFDLKLPGEESFTAMKAPCTFEVPANSSFDLVVKTPTDYCCSYISE